MTRAAIFLSVAMIAASIGMGANSAVAMGQESASTQNTNNSSQRTVVITGCLHSAGPGVYTLSDGQGTTYTLAGNTDTLQGHNEQEVKVTGQQAFTNSSSSASTASPASIQVNTADVVADHCAQSSSPQGQTSGSSAQAAAARDSAPSTATTAGQARVLSAAQEAQSASADPPQLPQTSTILPLLGLIGLGSLVAGLFARK
jgi:hypothetical protein